MAVFDEEDIAEYLRKSYLAVDGLWFLTLENEYSYDEAMRLDELVWDVLPKIQARKAKELLKIEGGSLSDLALALWLKFAAEGSEHRVIERTPNILRIEVHACTWLSALERSGRMSIAVDVCERICARELRVWAAQFSNDISVSVPRMLCKGELVCELIFSRPFAEETGPSVEEERRAAG